MIVASGRNTNNISCDNKLIWENICSRIFKNSMTLCLRYRCLWSVYRKIFILVRDRYATGFLILCISTINSINSYLHNYIIQDLKKELYLIVT